MVVKTEWLRRKLLRIRKRRKWACTEMERKKSKDVNIFVTGVSMSGDAELNEHIGTTGEDQDRSSKQTSGNSREDDLREDL